MLIASRPFPCIVKKLAEPFRPDVERLCLRNQPAELRNAADGFFNIL